MFATTNSEANDSSHPDTLQLNSTLTESCFSDHITWESEILIEEIGPIYELKLH